MFSEMPRYIGRVVGYSGKYERTFFRDISGRAVLSSLNCTQVHLFLNRRHTLTVGSCEFRNVKLKDSEQGGLHHNNLALVFCIMLMVFETMNVDS